MCDKDSSTSTSTPSGLYIYCTRVDAMTIPIGWFKSQKKKKKKIQNTKWIILFAQMLKNHASGPFRCRLFCWKLKIENTVTK